MVKTLVLVACTLAACTSNATPPDATAAVHDAPAGTPDGLVLVDAPAGARCTGALYDVCTGNAGCMSANCKLFNGSGFMACTQACSASNPCPTQGGAAVPCNNMGICKPSAPNACTP